MFKPSITVHKSKSGKLKVLAISEYAAECLEAYKNCAEPGQVMLIIKGAKDKFKKIPEGLDKKSGKPKK